MSDPVASLSDATAIRGSLFGGTGATARLGGFAGIFSAEKCFLICPSITAGSKSPTAITAWRSGRYQFR